MTPPPDSSDIGRLEALVRRLRAPDGCPWDRRQTLRDLRAYLLEEAHEVAAAIDEGDLSDLAEELGDLLFQVVFIAELGREQRAFDLAEVIDRIHRKMVDRHPHVFGDAVAEGVEDVQRAWEERKVRQNDPERSVLAGVPASLPALITAYRMTQKAAGVGFDWRRAHEVLAKVREEVAECEEAIEEGQPEAMREEIGDLLFTVANLARHLKIDPEAALAQSNRKFRRRFAALEATFAARGQPLPDASLEEMDQVWNEVKESEGPSS